MNESLKGVTIRSNILHFDFADDTTMSLKMNKTKNNSYVVEISCETMADIVRIINMKTNMFVQHIEKDVREN
jgi:hypothetical protein